MNNSLNALFDRESSEYDPEEDRTWIARFCNRRENQYLCEVEESFINDAFNLYGINNDFHLYKQALGVILGDYGSDLNDPELDENELEANAGYIYGMIHARYILTSPGLEAMYQKYKRCVFGTCPRVYCNNQNLLPIGLSDSPGVDTVKLFCPRCKEIYFPPPAFSNMDGAFFGSTFPHIFLLNYPEFIVNDKQSFEPTIYGYKIHESSPYYQSGKQE